jgi:hypothetical protein
MNPTCARLRRRPWSTAPSLGVALALVVAACSSGNGDAAGTTTTEPARRSTDPSVVECPTEVDAEQFASPEVLRDLLAEFNAFGLRSPASEQHEASIDWLARELGDVPGMEIEFDEYTIDRWQPTPEAAGDIPGRDLAAAGALTVDDGTSSEEIAVAGAVPFTLPTSADGATGELAFLAADEITAATAAGRIVVTEIPHSSLPYAAFGAIGHLVTDDVPTEGDYDRPYLRALDSILIDAGTAGAAGVVMVWDAPTEQLRGYWDPHTGTKFRVPAVHVGNDDVDRLRDLATGGATARLSVLAEWDEAPTRNLIATLPGQTRERIVVNTNTDSVTWVQENGTIAALALARYLGDLPTECRARDVQFALTTNHLGFSGDGTFRYGPELDEGFDAGTVAFVMAPEHLGTREILPGGPDNRLDYTGEGEVFAWSAPDESPVLVQATLDAVQRRNLERTAVLKGVGAPEADQVPGICSQGGLGTNFHGLLIPTIAGISGSWSLWAPGFGEDAIDFERMRDQALAFGDIAVALDDVPADEIAGGYVAARERRASGAATCDLTPPPAEAP